MNTPHLSNPPQPLRPNLRAEWLLDERVTFLNHGSFGAAPRCVLDEQAEWRRRIEAEPIEMLARRAPALIADVKAAVGAWLGMRPADFGLVTNATSGVNAVLRSLDLKSGDELLTTSHVYNAVRNAMRYVAGRAGATYREIDVPLPVRSSDDVAAAVLGALSPRTRLLVIDHVTSPTALVFPVERIVDGCNERGVDVLVDGAHAPGMLPLNVAGIRAAYYAGNLHKWACAPRGSGFLWARPDRQAAIHPLAVSHHYGEGFAREFDWQGTRDLGAWLAVPRALRFMAELGWERVMSHNHSLAVWAGAMLAARWGVEPVSPADGSIIGSMITLPMPPSLDRMSEREAEQFQQRLYDEGRVEAPIVLWRGRAHLRPCCQVYNAPAEYERAGDVVMSLARGR